MVEITDNEDLERWLQGKPQEVCIVIAVRAALRVYPMVARYGVTGDEKRATLLLTASRAMITSAAATVGPTADAAAAALSADAAAAALSADAAAALSADAAAAALSADAAAAALSADAAAAALSADAAANDAYFMVSRDATALEDRQPSVSAVLATPLWDGTKVPQSIRSAWSEFAEQPGVETGPWAFWIRWYEGFLNGAPLDWDLQRDIALLPNEDWEKGADHIAEMISKLELAHRTAVAPRLIRDDEAGVFRLEQESVLPEEILSFICDRVETVLKNALDTATNNGLGETSYETVAIRRALEQHREKPSLLATGLYDACLSFTSTIGERYPDDTSLINLRNALWTATEEICELSEPARKRCARLAALSKPEPLTQADRDEVSRVPDDVADQLDAGAETALREVAETIATDAEPAKSARARFTQWVTTVSIWMDRAMKGHKRAKWLADVVQRLARWWPDDSD